MATLPALTESDVRCWTDERSFGRGRGYFWGGYILNPRRQGDTIEARCQGSRPQPYHVEITLGPDGIALVLRYDQPAQIPLKLHQRFGRKHALEPWCIVLDDLRELNQR